MGLIHMTPAYVEQLTQSKFVCSACGSGRDCDCAAPALERDAARREANRQAARKYREQEKDQQNQPSRHNDVAVENIQQSGPDAEESEEWTDKDVLPRHQEKAFLIRADQARQFAVYSGKATPSLASQARMVAQAWSDLAANLEARCGNQT